MPWRECTSMNERVRFVILASEGYRDFSALCEEFGISRKTGYKWMNRYSREHSLNDLADQSRAPHSSPRRTDPDIEARVVALRREYGWGARKLQVLLKREGKSLAEPTLNRIIKRNGLLRRADVKGHATTRFERDVPNDLWQIDFKGPLRLPGTDISCFPLAIEDDHSRYLVGLFALPSIEAGPARAAIRAAFQAHGLPREILTDHGTPFYSTTSVHGLTTVSVEIMNQGIGLVHGAVSHPQTQGKLERLNRTLQEEIYFRGKPRTIEACQVLFDVFRETYNHVRPHESLDMDVPVSRYVASQRPYQSPPPAWRYDDRTTERQLNTQGCLDYAGQRLFVCEALAHQTVGVLELNSRLIVRYRDMLIREIALDTRHGKAIRL
jgi:transposase InsO family protein